MMWSERIKKLRDEFVGKNIMVEGEIFKISAVDYNGIVHIDKPGTYTETTAIYTTTEARKYLI